MIVIDCAEKPNVFKTFDKLKIPYKKEEIRIPKACDKIPIRTSEGELICVKKTDYQQIKKQLPMPDDISCVNCPFKSEKVGDFTNEAKSFIIERKRVDDYYMSMADGRLYEQARKMYKWIEDRGIAVVILEGMAFHEFFNDSINVFEDFDNQEMELKTLSPIEQVIKMHPTKEPWIWESIEDLASCGVTVIPTKSLEETVKMVQHISKGAGTEPS